MSNHRFPRGSKPRTHRPAKGARARRPDSPQPHTHAEASDAAAKSRSWRRLRLEVGLGTRLLDKLQKEHPGDPFVQLVGFFDDFRIPSATGRRRTVAFKTRDKYENILLRVLNTLQELNMRNRNLGDLSLRQVRAVVRHWESNGYSPSTMATLSTVLRRFGCWIGKPQLGPPLATLLRDPENGVRNTSTVKPRTWESRGINPEEVFRLMEQECHVAAMQLRLGWAFGLRVQEQLMLRPHEAHRGDRLAITRGAKGGRTRDINLMEPWEFELIERAKAIAAAIPTACWRAGTGTWSRPAATTTTCAARSGCTAADAFPARRMARVIRSQSGTTSAAAAHQHPCWVEANRRRRSIARPARPSPRNWATAASRSPRPTSAPCQISARRRDAGRPGWLGGSNCLGTIRACKHLRPGPACSPIAWPVWPRPASG